jgi:hypothetical protein
LGGTSEGCIVHFQIRGKHQGMNLKEIFENLNLGNVSIICFLLLSLIEISPIKINPWSALCKWLQRQLSLDEIKEDLMDSRRTRIIRFDDELIAKVEHRKDMFDAILVDCDKYEKYCKSHHGYVNSVADDSIHHIKEVYSELKREDAFLTYKKGREKK